MRQQHKSRILSDRIYFSKNLQQNKYTKCVQKETVML